MTLMRGDLDNFRTTNIEGISMKIKPFRQCIFFLDELLSCFECLEFIEPVPLDADVYHGEIKSPMDFITMEKKIFSNKYKSYQDFRQDLELIWENATTFHRDFDDIYKSAVTLRQRFLSLEDYVFRQGPEPKFLSVPVKEIDILFSHPTAEEKAHSIYFPLQSNVSQHRKSNLYFIRTIPAGSNPSRKYRGYNNVIRIFDQLNLPFIQKLNGKQLTLPLPRFYIAQNQSLLAEAVQDKEGLIAILFDVKLEPLFGTTENLLKFTSKVAIVQALGEIHSFDENVLSNTENYDNPPSAWIKFHIVKIIDRVEAVVNNEMNRSLLRGFYKVFRVSTSQMYLKDTNCPELYEAFAKAMIEPESKTYAIEPPSKNENNKDDTTSKDQQSVVCLKLAQKKDANEKTTSSKPPESTLNRLKKVTNSHTTVKKDTIPLPQLPSSPTPNNSSENHASGPNNNLLALSETLSQLSKDNLSSLPAGKDTLSSSSKPNGLAENHGSNASSNQFAVSDTVSQLLKDNYSLISSLPAQGMPIGNNYPHSIGNMPPQPSQNTLQASHTIYSPQNNPPVHAYPPHLSPWSLSSTFPYHRANPIWNGHVGTNVFVPPNMPMQTPPHLNLLGQPFVNQPYQHFSPNEQVSTPVPNRYPIQQEGMCHVNENDARVSENIFPLEFSLIQELSQHLSHYIDGPKANQQSNSIDCTKTQTLYNPYIPNPTWPIFTPQRPTAEKSTQQQVNFQEETRWKGHKETQKKTCEGVQRKALERAQKKAQEEAEKKVLEEKAQKRTLESEKKGAQQQSVNSTIDRKVSSIKLVLDEKKPRVPNAVQPVNHLDNKSKNTDTLQTHLASPQEEQKKKAVDKTTKENLIEENFQKEAPDEELVHATSKEICPKKEPFPLSKQIELYEDRSKFLFCQLLDFSRRKSVPIENIHNYCFDIKSSPNAEGYFKQVYFLHDNKNKVVQTFRRMTTAQRVIEIASLLKLKNMPHIGQITEVIEEKGEIIGLSMERYQKTLKQYTHAHSHHRLTAHQKMDLVVQLLECMKTIHDHGLAHRDLSEVNFMVNETTEKLADGSCKAEVYLIDFGKSTFVSPHDVHRWWIQLPPGETECSDIVPTTEEELSEWCDQLPWIRAKPDHGYRLYRSIQTMPRSRVDTQELLWLINPLAEDMYSIGTIIWKMFSETEPWYGILETDIKSLRDIVGDDFNIEKALEREVPGKLSKQLLLFTLKVVPQERKTAEEILEWIMAPEIMEGLVKEWEAYAPVDRQKRHAKRFKDEAVNTFPAKRQKAARVSRTKTYAMSST